MGEAKRKQQAAEPVKLPKVAILIPSADVWKADMGMALAGLTNYSRHGASLALINEKSSMITKARNSLVEKALTFGADYVLWIDSDLVFPADALLRLLAFDKDIVGTSYNKRVPPYSTLGKLVGDPGIEELAAGGLWESEFLPGGFVLVKTDVYRDLGWPWYFETYDEPEPNRYMSEDYNFCQKARAAGFKLWCDMDLYFQMGHVGEQVISVTRPGSVETAN